MKTLSVAVVAILTVLLGAFPIAAQWMGEPGGYSGWRGYSTCRMMDVTFQPVAPGSLPDPTAHTSQEWTEVVARMDKNMINQGMDPLAQDQRAAIVKYLLEHSRN